MKKTMNEQKEEVNWINFGILKKVLGAKEILPV